MAERPSKRRTRHITVVEILKKAKGGARKTHIMYEVGLSHDQNEQYLNALRKDGLITEESGTWKTTEKGRHVIEACEICHKLVETI